MLSAKLLHNYSSSQTHWELILNQMNATVSTTSKKPDPVFFKRSIQTISRNILLCPYLLSPTGAVPWLPFHRAL